jgi:2'-5' RNA ligase
VRLFVAVELAPGVCAAAEALIDELRRRVAHHAPAARVTWSGRTRMHLTLAFIGEAADSQVTPLVDALTGAARVPPFEATCAGLGTFPSRGGARVLWVGVTTGRDPLVSLGGRVTGAVSGCGLPGEERPLHPHLTLGRVREGAGLRPSAIFAGLEDEVLGTTPVDAITLFQSRLSPAGPEYVTVARLPLRGTGDPSA